MLTLLPILLFSVLIAIACVQVARASLPERLNRPPLSDEAFAAMVPEHDPEMVIKVRHVLSEAVGWDADEIYPDTTLLDLTEY